MLDLSLLNIQLLMGLRRTLVGGVDMVAQSIALGKKPHLIVATPGRLMGKTPVSPAI